MNIIASSFKYYTHKPFVKKWICNIIFDKYNGESLAFLWKLLLLNKIVYKARLFGFTI